MKLLIYALQNGNLTIDPNSKEYRKLYNSGNIMNTYTDHQTGEVTYIAPELDEVEVTAKRPNINDTTDKWMKRLGTVAYMGPQTILDTPVNLIGELMQGTNFDARRVIPSSIREVSGYHPELKSRTASDSFIGAGEVGPDGIRHAEGLIGKTWNGFLDVATDPWSWIGVGAAKEAAINAERALLRSAVEKGVKISPKKLNKLLTKELQRELTKNIDGGTAIKNAFNNVAIKNLGVSTKELGGFEKKINSIDFNDAKNYIDYRNVISNPSLEKEFSIGRTPLNEYIEKEKNFIKELKNNIANDDNSPIANIVRSNEDRQSMIKEIMKKNHSSEIDNYNNKINTYKSIKNKFNKLSDIEIEKLRNDKTLRKELEDFGYLVDSKNLRKELNKGIDNKIALSESEINVIRATAEQELSSYGLDNNFKSMGKTTKELHSLLDKYNLLLKKKKVNDEATKNRNLMKIVKSENDLKGNVINHDFNSANYGVADDIIARIKKEGIPDELLQEMFSGKQKLKNLSKIEQEKLLTKTGKEYLSKANNPKNIEKYKNLDKNSDDAFNINEESFNYYLNDGFENNERSIGKIEERLPNGTRVAGISGNDDDVLFSVMSFAEQNGKDFILDEEGIANAKAYARKNLDKFNEFMSNSDRDDLLSNRLNSRRIEIGDHIEPNDLYKVLSHEMKHDINRGGRLLDKTYTKKISDMFKHIDNVNENISKGQYEYLTKPTEFSSYIGTNMKDELVNAGYLKSVHEDISLDMLKDIIRSKSLNKIPSFKKYLPLIGDKKAFVKLVNMTPYGIAGIGTTVGLPQVQSKQNGGLLMFSNDNTFLGN